MIISDVVKKIEYDTERLCSNWASLAPLEQKAIKLYIIVGSIKMVSLYVGMTYWSLFRTLRDAAGDIRYYKQKIPRRYPNATLMSAADLAISGSNEAEIIEKTGADSELLSLMFGQYLSRIDKDDSMREAHSPLVSESGGDMLEIFRSWGARIIERTTYYNKEAYYFLLPYRWSVRHQFGLGRRVVFDDKNKIKASWSVHNLSEPVRIY